MESNATLALQLVERPAGRSHDPAVLWQLGPVAVCLAIGGPGCSRAIATRLPRPAARMAVREGRRSTRVVFPLLALASW